MRGGVERAEGGRTELHLGWDVCRVLLRVVCPHTSNETAYSSGGRPGSTVSASFSVSETSRPKSVAMRHAYSSRNLVVPLTSSPGPSHDALRVAGGPAVPPLVLAASRSAGALLPRAAFDSNPMAALRYSASAGGLAMPRPAAPRAPSSQQELVVASRLAVPDAAWALPAASSSPAQERVQ